MQTVQTRLDAAKQGLYCLLTGISMRSTIKVKIFTRNSKTTNGLVQMIRMDKSVGQKRLKSSSHNKSC